jgi:hypothetical protein
MGSRESGLTENTAQFVLGEERSRRFKAPASRSFPAGGVIKKLYKTIAPQTRPTMTAAVAFRAIYPCDTMALASYSDRRTPPGPPCKPHSKCGGRTG